VEAPLPSHAGIAYREVGPRDGPALLALHGFPGSSYMWRGALEAAAAEGWRAVAPDLPGFGDSPPDRPGTWERQIEAVARLHAGLELGQVVLAAHDWGGLIGLRWACDNPGVVRGLVLSATGFFADARWHGMARSVRAEGGEKVIGDMTRASFGALMDWAVRDIDRATVDEYWKCLQDDERRGSILDLYRSGDFEKLAPYAGRLAELGVPALLLWGDEDQFAPLGGAYRFRSELPDAELVVLEGVGHFLWIDEAERAAAELARFLRRLR
jgi:haloalkane dehalogenase